MLRRNCILKRFLALVLVLAILFTMPYSAHAQEMTGDSTDAENLGTTENETIPELQEEEGIVGFDVPKAEVTEDVSQDEVVPEEISQSDVTSEEGLQSEVVSEDEEKSTDSYTSTETSNDVTSVETSISNVTDSSAKNTLEIKTDAKEENIIITLSNASVSSSAKVLFPTWGEVNGQNDIKWYEGKKISNGVYQVTVPISNHKESGKYHVHVYSSENGKNTYLTAGTVTVSGSASKGVTINESKSSAKYGKYRIEVSNVTSPAGIKSVSIPVWSNKNGQDDIVWYPAKQEGSVWYVELDISKHHYDSGTYTAHAYAIDNRGIQNYVGGTTFTVQAMEKNVLEISLNGTQSQLTATLRNASTNGVVKFPTWGDVNGQNDIVWYQGTKIAPNTYQVTVPISNHKESGKYNVHVYSSENGKNTYLTAGTVTVSGSASKGVTINESMSSAKYGKYRIEVSNVTSPAGIKSVSIPVWSNKNGQDDIVWYPAKQEGSVWYVELDISKHHYDSGTYTAHAYATDNRGIQNYVGGTTFTVQAIASNSLEISLNASQSQMTVTLRNASTNGVVKFPTWGVVNGQNDIVWYQGTKIAPNTYQVVVDISKHKEIGIYNVHVYASQNNTNTLLAAKSISVSGVSSAKLAITPNNNNGTFNVTVSDIVCPTTITRVQIPVWSTKNGQDDIHWYEAKKNGNTWQFTVDTANHNFETGQYTIHVYATDERGIRQLVATNVAVMEAAPVKVSAVPNSNKINVDIAAAGIRNAKNVRVAVWGVSNGQNDLVWYNMTRTIGTQYNVQINLFDHLETGVYNCHFYVTNSDGSNQLIGYTTFSVSDLPTNYFRITDIDNEYGTCKATLYFPKANIPVSRISMAVWTEKNGQDDIKWYQATKEGNAWIVNIDSLNHKAESGTYIVHVYVQGIDGSKQLVQYTSFQMTRTARRYQNPSPYYQIQDLITLSGGGYILTYGYEGVKVMQVIRRLGIGTGVGMNGALYTQSVVNAVANFQRAQGLPVTGNVDLTTWLRMGFTEDQWYQWGAYVTPLKVNRNSTREEHIEAMISTAYAYLGNDYVIGASGPPGTGVDCSGLVMQALYSAGLDVSPINPVRHAYPGYEYESRNMWNSPYFLHVSYDQRQRGDLIFYQGKSGYVNHVAIYLGNNMVIESYPNKVVVAPIINSQHSSVKGVVRPFI